MQLIKYIVIFVILLIVETNFVQLIAIKDVTPDLILIFVIIVSLREHRNRAGAIGFFAGLIQDAMTTHFFGLSALAKTIVGFWGSFFQRPNKKYNLISYLIAVVSLVLIHEVIFGFIYKLSLHLGFFKGLIRFIIPRALYTSFFALMVYLLFSERLWKTEERFE